MEFFNDALRHMNIMGSAYCVLLTISLAVCLVYACISTLLIVYYGMLQTQNMELKATCYGLVTFSPKSNHTEYHMSVVRSGLLQIE